MIAWWTSYMSDRHIIAADGTNATSIKSGAGTITSYEIFNNAGYPVFVKFHDTASAPTPGADVFKTIGIQSADSAGNKTYWQFQNGIGMSIVKGIEDGDTTPIAADDCVINLTFV
jgi:hypothetical protein